MTDDSAHPSLSPLVSRLHEPVKLWSYGRWIRALILCLAWTFALSLGGNDTGSIGQPAQAQDISNDTLRLKLNVTPEGVPVIEEAVWQATGQTVFRDLGTPEGLSAWFPESLGSTIRTTIANWRITEGADFTTAEATCQVADRMLISWIVELPKRGQVFRLHVRLSNRGKTAWVIDSFPAWLASWDVAGKSQWARWWRSLEYNRIEQTLNSANRIRLGSRLHSSDDAQDGVNPYWVVGGTDNRIYFGVQWCGGWTANIQGLGKGGFNFSVGLPPEETQLVLNRGETIDGPALLVTPIPGADDINDRATWMRQRYSLGQTLYPSPSLSFPLIYNHWYAARQRVDRNFLKRQIASMSRYSFEAFIIDAGWFADGLWKPDSTKFQPHEFVQMLASLKRNGIKPGLWSTPQYVSATNNDLALTFEQPAVVSNLIGGYLVDMSQAAFPDHLTEHVQMLRHKYSVDYWKYDKWLFTEQSRAGAMKNVIGFQNALQAVRRANPDLTIENCLNGGRMINEFTLLATQTSWLCDLGSRGKPDPQGNIKVALNALDFIFPWAALRFTINLDGIDQSDDETLRLYCRSAMAGVWGFSTDLSQIGERQRSIILKEIQNYRTLNHLKSSCIYDLQLPDDNSGTAGVTFYSKRRRNAGILLYRWQRNGAFDEHVELAKLKPWVTYRVVDVDTRMEKISSGSDLINDGVDIPFSSQRLSALLFVEPLTESQKPPEP
ncbi:MAG: alpha-galactosidase [Blastocatellia bacterium]